MNGSFLYELLVDPITREALLFDNTSNTLRSSDSSSSYSLVESVPRVIIDDNEVTIESGLHRKYNSVFNYGDHYQKDATLFDYSKNNMAEITKIEFSRLRESVIREVSDDLSVILDVGCGNGWVSKKLIPLGKKVISMDISTVNPINAIKEIQHKNHAGLIADVYNLPLKENSIDCIIASEILEHVPDPKIFIFSLIKLLKQNGKLIITTPYNEIIEYFLCVHCNQPTPKYAHLHSFNEDNIGHFIPQTGITWAKNIFMNKYLSLTRLNFVLKFLPFNIWILIDKVFNKVFNKPTRMKIVLTKQE